MTIINVSNLKICYYNAINAFANSDINESTYYILSEKWKKTTNILYTKVLLLLLKAFYELKQALALWYQNLRKIFIDLELKQVLEIKCFFINIYILVFFYVNDIIVLYEKKYIKQMKEFQNKFFQIYEIRYIDELQWFLEIHISRNHNQCILTLYQNSYIDKFIIKFNVNTASKVSEASLNSFDNDFEKNSNQIIV